MDGYCVAFKMVDTYKHGLLSSCNLDGSYEVRSNAGNKRKKCAGRFQTSYVPAIGQRAPGFLK